MNTYKVKGGQILNEEDIERLGQQAEEGNFLGAPGEWVIRPQGRPRLCNEDLVTITLRVPVTVKEAIDKKANSAGETRSEFMRKTLLKAIA